MPELKPRKEIKNVGFISVRFSGTDGVSLETEKWAHVFESEGVKTFYFAGELDRPPERSYLVPEAHFTHPDIKDVYNHSFGITARDRSISKKIYQLAIKLKDDLYDFIKKFDIDLIIPENAVTIPMNIPLGIAITELIAETNIQTIAHHHDFYWERDRFMINAIQDYLNMAFPPVLPSITHVVINSVADAQLSLRTGVSAFVAPNVMEFEKPPPPPDDYSADVRQALGIADDELLVLQPTRVVQRKGIEHAIELLSRLGRKAKLVISHASGDEGYDYEKRLREYSKLMKVDTLFVDDIINEKRGLTKDGRKIYTLEDIYPFADLVTYPSTFEGFGNAFLEAVYFKKPVVVNAYSIYTKDIKPKGFSVIEIDGYVTEAAVEKTKVVLDNKEFRRQMVEHNYELGLEYFSYGVLHRGLRALLVLRGWIKSDIV
ncbi:MAG: glycosyltransferase family 4 protein [Deltaproteobacteria bacterium]|nr:glycosyltransferase family 4 protein [Deltaproteobacteria bacterium]